jgi:hypothetical protein
MKRITIPAILLVCVFFLNAEVLAGEKATDLEKAKNELKPLLEKDTDAKGLSVYELATLYMAREHKVTLDKEEQALEDLRELLIWEIRKKEPDYRSPMQIEKIKALEERKLVTRFYDVGGIVTPPPDFPSPPMGLGAALMGRFGGYPGFSPALELNDEDDGFFRPYFTREQLHNFLSNLLPLEDSDGELELHRNKLVARLTEAEHEKLTALLDKLRPHTTRAVALEVRLVNMTPELFARMQANGTGKGSILSQKAEKLLEDALKKRKTAKVHTEGHILAKNCQTVSLREGGQMSVLMDYELNVSGPIPIINARVGVLHEGLLVELKPVVSRDGRNVTVDIGACFCEIKRPIEKIILEYGDLQQPEMDISRIAATVRIPAGSTALVGGVTARRNGKTWDKELMLLVKASVVSGKNKEEKK